MTVNKSDIKTALLAFVAAAAFIAAAVVSVAPAASTTFLGSQEKEPQQSVLVKAGLRGA